MITAMLIGMVECKSGVDLHYESFRVDSSTLKFWYPGAYNEYLNTDQFFNLSIRYLDEFIDEVVGTWDAVLQQTFYGIRK